MTAAQLGQNLQSGTKAAAEGFNRFVEGDERLAPRSNASGGPAPDKRDFWESFGEAPKGPAPEKKDFWDDFAAAGETAAQTKPKPTSIGTSAMKKPSTGAGNSKEEGGWGDW